MSDHTKSTALAPFVVMPQTLTEYREFADILIRAKGFVPSSLDSKESVLCALLYGAELGLTPFQSVQNIFIVNGKPATYTNLMRALVEKSGLVAEGPNVKWTGDIKNGTLECTVSVRRQNKEWAHSSFSVADANTAGLWNKGMGWQKYPKRMLQHRAMGWVLQDEFPDVVRGMRTVEEMSGNDPRIDELINRGGVIDMGELGKVDTDAIEEVGDGAGEPESIPEATQIVIDRIACTNSQKDLHALVGQIEALPEGTRAPAQAAYQKRKAELPPTNGNKSAATVLEKVAQTRAKSEPAPKEPEPMPWAKYPEPTDMQNEETVS